MKSNLFPMDYNESSYLSFYNEDNIKTFSDVLNYFPLNRDTHTMSYNIDKYVCQKLPTKEIKNYLEKGYKIEIHGIYPKHFTSIIKKLNYSIIQEIKFSHIPHKKLYNFIRPGFFLAVNNLAQNVILIAVTPGSDYIYHYAGLVRHYLSLITPQYNQMLKIYRYPYVEDNIDKWSSMSENLILKDEIVIIGFVAEIQTYLKDNLIDTPTKTIENGYYCSTKYLLNNGIKLNFVGVKYSFWGNISAKLLNIFCTKGAKEIIYIGKLGTLGSPNELYCRIFSPTRYVIMKYDKIVKFVDSLENNFVKSFPEYNSDLHLSVPTVMEEDNKQRKKAAAIGVVTIDNEISQMALAIEEFNKANNKNISFSCIHFATDYLKQAHEKDDMVTIGLYNNREKNLLLDKKFILRKISLKLWDYLTK